jgi:acyl carrier protein
VSPGTPTLEERIRDLLVRRLKLEMRPQDIDLDSPIFGEGLGLDSIDALELVVGLEQEFSIQIPDADLGKRVFASIRSIADYVRRQAGHLSS